jgi:hypothetical protein
MVGGPLQSPPCAARVDGIPPRLPCPKSRTQEELHTQQALFWQHFRTNRFKEAAGQLPQQPQQQGAAGDATDQQAAAPGAG